MYCASSGTRLSSELAYDVSFFHDLFFSVSCPIHTDIEWDTYLSDGFQVWYLVHNEDCLGTGATCSSSRRTGCRRPAPRRCGWRGTASSRYSPPPARAAPPRRWTRPSCAPGTWTSGDMRPGECLVMAVNFRVAVAPEGLRVAWGPWSPDSCLNRWRARRCRRGRGAGGEDRGLIYPGRYDLAA
ncbi:unnamed protein product [Prorocentrum cordatum]|uniref:Uncharacterized protein n=1 Tax=Prorocentrum cordatum TaxID=2364126 RepID=A0ABN9PBM9_9DINO|nr:unnamed protein product [Polarella glacialis]